MGESERDYFGKISAALHAQSVCQPVLVIDRGRLDENIEQLLELVPAGITARIVTKSLPSLSLLRHVVDRVGTTRLMTFNLPMLTTLAQEMPGFVHLLGKPFPVAAAERFVETCGVDAALPVQWLIDTSQRLDEYDQLARRHGGVLFNVSIEIDIGLHRGGFADPDALRSALEQIAASEVLEFAGLMGYEAHIAKIPRRGGLRDRAFAAAMERFETAISIVDEVFGHHGWGRTYNSAGSMTLALHRSGTVANDFSFGSALLKGTDFDLDTTEAFRPAVFIATPAIKVLDTTELPGVEALSRAAAKVRRSRQRSVFIHGGHWFAEPAFPSRLSYSSLFGRSSNQELLTLAGDADLAVDDFIYLRPTQTEAVMMQFGDLAVFDGGEIVDWWPAMSPSA